jgi:hypothetical protein
MVTRTKTNGNRETQQRETYVHPGRSTHSAHVEEDDLDEIDDLQDEYNDDKNQRMEGYDENEYDADEKRKRREAEMADGDTAAHETAKPVKTPSRRGFAAMDKEKQRMIASKGGKASHGGGRKPSKNR